MRGSVYYQVTCLVKAVFRAGAKKTERIDPDHPHYRCVASYQTMATYRRVWENFGHYLREHWGVKDFERVNAEHVEAYIEYKVEYYPTKQYAEKLVSALGKLEIALERFSASVHDEPKRYDFSVRQTILNEARRLDLVVDGYHNRVYEDPDSIIGAMSKYEHRLAAKIQNEGGARSEAVTLIRPAQLLGIERDTITDKEVGVIWTKEKGGKEGKVFVSIRTYSELTDYIDTHGKFSIRYGAYADDIRTTCGKLGIKPHGSHGFRWTFAQRRILIYQDHGYTYEQALQGVSWEMKHGRADISTHYLGG